MDTFFQRRMVLNLDISKAYDRVSQDCLVKILKKFGFGDRLLNLIKQYIFTIKHPVLVNGAPRESFDASRGVRQGDTLSPYLFITLAKFIRRNSITLVNNGALQGVKPASSNPPIILQQFFDDTILFGITLILESREWKTVLNYYAKTSGLQINYEKSNIFFLILLTNNKVKSKIFQDTRLMPSQVLTFKTLFLK